MPKHLKHLEHKGGELFLPENELNRKRANEQLLIETAPLNEDQKEAKKAKEQQEYLNPYNDLHPDIWDGDID